MNDQIDDLKDEVDLVSILHALIFELIRDGYESRAGQPLLELDSYRRACGLLMQRSVLPFNDDVTSAG